jgi:hypothetical protein
MAEEAEILISYVASGIAGRNATLRMPGTSTWHPTPMLSKIPMPRRQKRNVGSTAPASHHLPYGRIRLVVAGGGEIQGAFTEREVAGL